MFETTVFIVTYFLQKYVAMSIVSRLGGGGGSFTESSGTTTSSNYPNKYEENFLLIYSETCL